MPGTTTDDDPTEAANCTRPGPTTPSPALPRSGSSVPPRPAPPPRPGWEHGRAARNPAGRLGRHRREVDVAVQRTRAWQVDAPAAQRIGDVPHPAGATEPVVHQRSWLPAAEDLPGMLAVHQARQ